jgi:hypothetical protein
LFQDVLIGQEGREINRPEATMSTVTLVVIVIIAILVVCAVGFLAYTQSRRRSLRERFGPEYDRAVKHHESTREAEQELLARQKRHDELDLKPLDPETRRRHRAQWRLVQEHFVDAPGTAVVEADHLLVMVMGERGYPTEDYEQRAADLSVEHAATVDRYRKAHDISARAKAEQASTEDLRQAMVHYRALFTELVGEDGGRTGDTITEARPGTAEPVNGRDEASTRPGPEASTRRESETSARPESDASARSESHAAGESPDTGTPRHHATPREGEEGPA